MPFLTMQSSVGYNQGSHGEVREEAEPVNGVPVLSVLQSLGLLSPSGFTSVGSLQVTVTRELGPSFITPL